MAKPKELQLSDLKKDENGSFVRDENYKKYVKRTVGAWMDLRRTSPIKATLEEIIAWKNEGCR